MAKLTLVMNMLAFTLLWKLASSPPSAASTANMIESPATTSGLADSRCAAAAGVMASRGGKAVVEAEQQDADARPEGEDDPDRRVTWPPG
jgi:hypothetical protein